MNLSNIRRRMSAVAAAGILAGTVLLGASDAQAMIYNWNVSGTFFDLETIDSGSVSGTFQFDSSDSSFSEIELDLTGNTRFGNVSFSKYLVSSASSSFVEFVVDVPTPNGAPVIIIELAPDFFSSVGVNDEFNDDFTGYTIALAECTVNDCVESDEIALDLFGTATSVAAVPVPAALPLFGTGLAIMGFLGWRRKSKAAAA